MKAFVIIEVRALGNHKWTTAPVERTYLRHNHPHIFRFKVSIQVSNLDRGIEFHDLWNRVNDFIHNKWQPKDEPAHAALEFGKMSCEQIAESIIKDIVLAYNLHNKKRTVEVEVFEEQSAGGKVIYDGVGDPAK